jgi:hypothetical protein
LPTSSWNGSDDVLQPTNENFTIFDQGSELVTDNNDNNVTEGSNNNQEQF